MCQNFANFIYLGSGLKEMAVFEIFLTFYVPLCSKKVSVQSAKTPRILTLFFYYFRRNA